MPKALRLFLLITVFAAVFTPVTTPSWWLMEKLWTRNFSNQNTVSHIFAVLVRRADHGNRYGVDFYPDMEEQSRLVTEFNDADLENINRDLRASISAERSHYVYFKVLKHDKGYTDVQLETPTTGDFWAKTAYRIEKGEAHLLRVMDFGPVFGMTVAILPAFAGALATWCCRRLLRKITREASSHLVSESGQETHRYSRPQLTHPILPPRLENTRGVRGT